MATAAIERNAFDAAALESFDAAASTLELDNDFREIIRYRARILIVNLPVRMDNGRIRRFEVYRVQH